MRFEKKGFVLKGKLVKKNTHFKNVEQTQKRITRRVFNATSVMAMDTLLPSVLI